MPRSEDGVLIAPLQELSVKQIAFAKAYCAGPAQGSASKAAREAGYSKSFIESGKASKMLKIAHVVFAINQQLVKVAGLDRTHRASLPKTGDSGVDHKFEVLDEIAHFDIGSLFIQDPDAPGNIRMRPLTEMNTRCLSEIKVKLLPGKGYEIQVKAYNKIEAIRAYFHGKGVGKEDVGGVREITVNYNFGKEEEQTVKVINPDG